ncbi:uncharacterized protein N7477_007036 [Penicillium maclennaniae]|uniref:uncharacterized protein n=1 Tax=Penicillium maclennaniae TaxID=1343394 RepID=UPI0025419AD8|nr:uncharacterized protein N7477_007036 [Penicillium maclennaniae]KAJ5668466.1 hypothetical protein N7477_007036 [Penicillium maclennaniae]
MRGSTRSQPIHRGAHTGSPDSINFNFLPSLSSPPAATGSSFLLAMAEGCSSKEGQGTPELWGRHILPTQSLLVRFEHFIKNELLPAIDTDLEQYSLEPGDVYKLALEFTKKLDLFHKRGSAERDINIVIVRKAVEEEPDLRPDQLKQEPGARDAQVARDA